MENGKQSVNDGTEHAHLCLRVEEMVKARISAHKESEGAKLLIDFLYLLPMEALEMLEELLISESGHGRVVNSRNLFGIPLSTVKRFIEELLERSIVQQDQPRGEGKRSELGYMEAIVRDVDKLTIMERKRGRWRAELTEIVQKTIVPYLREQLIPTSSSSITAGKDRAEARTYLLQKCKDECKRRELNKGATVERGTKHAIAKAIGMKNLPKLADFKSGEKTYHRVSKMLSESGYSKKGSSRIK